MRGWVALVSATDFCGRFGLVSCFADLAAAVTACSHRASPRSTSRSGKRRGQWRKLGRRERESHCCSTRNTDLQIPNTHFRLLCSSVYRHVLRCIELSAHPVTIGRESMATKPRDLAGGTATRSAGRDLGDPTGTVERGERTLETEDDRPSVAVTHPRRK